MLFLQSVTNKILQTNTVVVKHNQVIFENKFPNWRQIGNASHSASGERVRVPWVAFPENRQDLQDATQGSQGREDQGRPLWRVSDGTQTRSRTHPCKGFLDGAGNVLQKETARGAKAREADARA